MLPKHFKPGFGFFILMPTWGAVGGILGSSTPVGLKFRITRIAIKTKIPWVIVLII